MPDNRCTVLIDGEKKEYPEGSHLLDAAMDCQSHYDTPILLAVADGNLTELHREIHDGQKIHWVTIREEAGYSAYCRSVNLLFLKAVYNTVPKEDLKRVILHFTVSGGYYYTIEGKVSIDRELIRKIEDRMKDYVRRAIPIRKRSVRINQARGLFRQHRMYDKEELFRYRRSSTVNIYDLDGFEDYFYGYMVWNTSVLKHFRLFSYEDGIIVQMPSHSRPEELEPFHPSEKLFRTRIEAAKQSARLDVDTVGRLNRAISEGRTKHIILVQEALQEARIASIAQKIASRKQIKFVLIAGPSSSGKTTFSKRLSIQLTANGMTPHPVSLDNYYLDREQAPKDADGNYDFECLEALDLELFHSDMNKLLAGEEIRLPRYNFQTGYKEYKGEKLRLGENDILVLEGIHGLNDRLMEGIREESKFRIYISALTQLNIDEHNRIPTTDGRLIRRIVRDYRTRATSAAETIAMWDSVRRGEEQYIFPNQDKADEMVNSALMYEMAVLKIYAEPLLFQIPEGTKEHIEAKRLLKFLDYFIGIPSEDIPKNSILREFIGGSTFDV